MTRAGAEIPAPFEQLTKEGPTLMDTNRRPAETPTIADAVAAWADATYARTVASNAHGRNGSIVDRSSLAATWFSHAERLRRRAIALMEGAISGQWRSPIPGATHDRELDGQTWDAFSGTGGRTPAEIRERGELLVAGVKNAENIGALVLEFRRDDELRAQRLADTAFGMDATITLPPVFVFEPKTGMEIPDDVRRRQGAAYARTAADDTVAPAWDDPTMTPAECGAVIEQEELAREAASWAQEAPEDEPTAVTEDTAWLDDTDSLPGGFDPVAELAQLQQETDHEEGTNR